jgi:hypothetical protein
LNDVCLEVIRVVRSFEKLKKLAAGLEAICFEIAKRELRCKSGAVAPL